MSAIVDARILDFRSVCLNTAYMAEATTPPEILLVDDDAETRASLRELLILDGYRVEQASNGREALERVRVRRPNLVLLDVSMPEMDGYEVTRWLKSHLRRFVP